MGLPKNCKEIEDQTITEKMYLLKLVATQILGEKWAYYRKIKHAGKGFSFLKEASLMEQMKATQSALKFTSKSASKAYRSIYSQSLKEISKYCNLKEGFPGLLEVREEDGENFFPALTVEQDAVLISWTPLKFFLPAKSIRSKGSATQRHTEGLIAKLYFKVLGFYVDPANWDKSKLMLYLRKIKKDSSHSEVVAELEPLKKDLQDFANVYELFKFGKASLSKDTAQEADTFDDAMAVESFDSQIKTLYWYEFIYTAMEMFIYRYFLTLVTSTSSSHAINYLAAIFEPALKKVIENRNLFLGSFETDRSKLSFRKPYLKYKEKRRANPFTKLLKTKQGIFKTYFYNENLLERLSIDFDLSGIPEEKSQWGIFCKHYVLGIDRPSQSLINIDEVMDEIQYSKDLAAGKAVPGMTGKLQRKLESLGERKSELKQKFAKLENEKNNLANKIEEQLLGKELSQEEKKSIQDLKGKIEKYEIKLDKDKKKLKIEYEKVEKKREKLSSKGRLSQSEIEEKEALLKKIEDDEEEVNASENRQNALMQIMVVLIRTTNYKRQAKHNILERFKKRVEGDKELLEKRISELHKKLEKKIREMKKKADKLKRLKQDDAYEVILGDIEKLKKSTGERFISIRVDAKKSLQKQRKRLKRLFHSISEESEVSEANTSRMILKLADQVDPESNFSKQFSEHVSTKLNQDYVKDLEPFYQNMFNILDIAVEEKVILVQALDKAGGKDGIKLSLTDEEDNYFQQKIDQLKAKIEKESPGLLQSKVFCLTDVIVFEELLKLNIDNTSLKKFLFMKIISPKTNKPVKLSTESAGHILELNKIINPIPKNDLIVEGKEKEKDPQKSINTNLLHKLLGK